MKNILITLLFSIAGTCLFGQVKVHTTGNTIVGSSTIVPNAKLEVYTTTTAANQDLFKVSDGTSGSFSVSEGTSAGGAFIPLFKFEGSGVTGFPGATLGVVSSDGLFALGAANTVIAQTSTGSAVSSANTFMVRNGATPQMTIAANGNVGIGYDSPSVKLHVNGSILASGSVTGMSDKRLKKNINDYSKGLEEIMRIHPVTYQYNGKGGIKDTETEHVGIIAQEFQEISPESITPVLLEENLEEIVSQADSYYKNNNRDITGGNLPELEKNEYLSVSDKAITYMLVNAVQEQQDMIDAQSALIEELSKKITNLTIGNSHVINADLESHTVAELGDAFPNPTNDFSQIEYIIPVDATNSVMNVFDVQGRIIKTVSIDHTGEGTLRLNTEGVPSGVYTYQLSVDGNVIGSKKVVVSK